MRPEDLKATPGRCLNLNLLYSLDAILQAPTLTDAGRMISLTQSAMSMALRRLRDQFGDDLVVYGTGPKRLTAPCESLRPLTSRVLREAHDASALPPASMRPHRPGPCRSQRPRPWN